MDADAGRQAQVADGRRRVRGRGAQAGERQDRAQDDAGVGEEGCRGDGGGGGEGETLMTRSDGKGLGMSGE